MTLLSRVYKLHAAHSESEGFEGSEGLEGLDGHSLSAWTMKRLACPGDQLSSAETHSSGPGTCIIEGAVVALLAGTVHIEAAAEGLTDQKPTVSVLRKGAQPVFPQPGSLVTVKVTRVSPRIANAEILCVGSKTVSTPFSGVIRSQDVRATEVDKVEILSCFRPGDLVRAEVLSLGDARSYLLTTAKNELGVIFAKSLAVGSTKFDALIEAIDNEAVADELAARGYSALVIQVGAGAYVPHRIVPRGASEALLPNGLRVETFQFAPDLDRYMRSAGLIISHAGSGSLFEALGMGKPVVAVPNSILMANHQAELAEHLERMGHCAAATPDTLLEVLQHLDTQSLVPYKKGDPSGIAAAIDKHMGF